MCLRDGDRHCRAGVWKYDRRQTCDEILALAMGWWERVKHSGSSGKGVVLIESGSGLVDVMKRCKVPESRGISILYVQPRID